MAIKTASDRDWSYILSLSKKHAEELGFIPAAAMQSYLHRGRVRLATENADPVGFFLHGGLQASQVRIFQACVQLDARGLRHGLTLLSSLITDAALSGTRFLSLHCRDTLESNGFWSACGFKVGALLPGGKARGKVLFEWHLDINEALSNPSLPYAANWLRRVQGSLAGGEVEGAGSGLPRSQEEIARLFGIKTSLDPEERNVRIAEGGFPSASTIACEALRTLELAHSLP
jgi:hypothetical protein